MASGYIIYGLLIKACQLGSMVLVGTFSLYSSGIMEVCLLFQAFHFKKGIKYEMKMERFLKYEII